MTDTPKITSETKSEHEVITAEKTAFRLVRTHGFKTVLFTIDRGHPLASATGLLCDDNREAFAIADMLTERKLSALLEAIDEHVRSATTNRHGVTLDGLILQREAFR